MNFSCKIFFFWAILGGLLVGLGCSHPNDAQSSEGNSKNASVINDSLLAQRFGADEYGMKKYVFAFLNKGPNRDLDSLEAMNLQRAHLKNIEAMAKAGDLILAGPFFGKGDPRGIYIFNVSTLEEAQKLVESDPAVQAGSLAMELREWYGSAALMAVNDIHSKINQKSITQ